MGVGGHHHAPAAFTPGKNPVPIVQEAGWASKPDWIGAENLAPTAIRSPDLPARSESLYRLSHPGSSPVISSALNEGERSMSLSSSSVPSWKQLQVPNAQATG